MTNLLICIYQSQRPTQNIYEINSKHVFSRLIRRSALHQVGPRIVVGRLQPRVAGRQAGDGRPWRGRGRLRRPRSHGGEMQGYFRAFRETKHGKLKSIRTRFPVASADDLHQEPDRADGRRRRRGRHGPKCSSCSARSRVRFRISVVRGVNEWGVGTLRWDLGLRERG